MKHSIAVACASIAAASITSVFAGPAASGDITLDPTPFVSSVSRADVRADIPRYGASEWNRQSVGPFEATGYTRAQARADYLKFHVEVNAMNGEDSGSAYLKGPPSGVNTREMGAPAK